MGTVQSWMFHIISTVFCPTCWLWHQREQHQDGVRGNPSSAHLSDLDVLSVAPETSCRHHRNTFSDRTESRAGIAKKQSGHQPTDLFSRSFLLCQPKPTNDVYSEICIIKWLYWQLHLTPFMGFTFLKNKNCPYENCGHFRRIFYLHRWFSLEVQQKNVSCWWWLCLKTVFKVPFVSLDQLVIDLILYRP